MAATANSSSLNAKITQTPSLPSASGRSSTASSMPATLRCAKGWAALSPTATSASRWIRKGCLPGEALPDYESLAAYLLYTTSGAAYGTGELARKNADGLFHGSDAVDHYLLYEPNLDYLRSNDAMLNLERAQRIRDASCQGGKRAVVYGAGKYISQRDLTRMKITFCQLPHALQER